MISCSKFSSLLTFEKFNLSRERPLITWPTGVPSQIDYYQVCFPFGGGGGGGGGGWGVCICGDLCDIWWALPHTYICMYAAAPTHHLAH